MAHQRLGRCRGPERSQQTHRGARRRQRPVHAVDGGTEALLRPQDWPARMPLKRMPRMLWNMYQAPKRGQVADYSGATAAEDGAVEEDAAGA